MALTFYATDDDLAEVWRWLFQVPGMKVLEVSLAPDQESRYFAGLEEIADHLRNGAYTIAAWPSQVGGEPQRKEVIFTESVKDELGARGRTILESPALIKMSRLTSGPECLNPCQISRWTEKGARQRSMFDEEVLDSIDWPKLKSIVTSIERQIKKHSLGKLHSHPIMPTAYDRLVTGDLELWNFGEKVGYPSSYVTSANVR